MFAFAAAITSLPPSRTRAQRFVDISRSTAKPFSTCTWLRSQASTSPEPVARTTRNRVTAAGL